MRIIILDTGPLGKITHPKADPAATAWLTSLLSSGAAVRVPAISDYELRRELIRSGKPTSIVRLNQMEAALGFLELNDAVIKTAAALWATARNNSKPTAHDHALDGDMLLCAQAIEQQVAGHEVTVATTNVGHLAHFVPAVHWLTIS